MRGILISIIVLFALINAHSLAQKNEHEERVKSTEVPDQALEWLDSVEIKKKKLRWYLEVTSGRRSYEVKFIHDHHLYSIEFDTLGNVEDIEVLHKRKELNPEIYRSIQRELDRVFDRSKIVKVQVQYTSPKSSENLIRFLNENRSSGVEVNYEIEFEAKKREDSWKMYEGRFDNEGKLFESREIITRSTENLNY